MWEGLRALLGVFVFMGICVCLSEKRSRIDWKLAGGGVLLQFVLAWAFLSLDGPLWVVERLSSVVVSVMDYSRQGAVFLFGQLSGDAERFGTILAFRVLPSILFFSALSSLLFYLGILPAVIRGIAWVLRKVMRISGAEAFAVAANVFVGQTEAPLMVRPYLASMTRSELCALMTGGMATIAGGVMVAYIHFLGGTDPSQHAFYARHLITASILSAPAAIVFAKILVPEDQEFRERFELERSSLGVNALDALAKGTAQGLELALIIGAILIVFTSLVALLNAVLSAGIGSWTGLDELVASVSGGRYERLCLEWLMSYLFAPCAWLMGIPAEQCLESGRLLGEKLVMNEFVAYLNMGASIREGFLSDERTRVILTYALCGFANFASVGIQIAGIAALAPTRREDLSRLAMRALLAGTLACLMTGCLAGLFYAW
jgi:CNT family concentrative nucleoside transporter